MSKEIKFRLRKDGQIVGYEMWFRGDGSYKPRWIYAPPDNVFSLSNSYIEHDSKDEFIGLHDKSGAEIYKGDIVGYQWLPKLKQFYAVVPIKYEAGCFCVFIGRMNVRSHIEIGHLDTGNNIKIIGNTTDNPELLKETA